MDNTLAFEKNIYITIRGTSGAPEITVTAEGTYHDADGATPTLKESRKVKLQGGEVNYEPNTTEQQLHAQIVAAMEAKIPNP